MSDRNLICLAVFTYNVSGTERIVFDIAQALHESGNPSIVILPKVDALKEYKNSIQRYTRDVIEINEVKGKSAVGKNFQNSFQIFRKIKPQYIHFHCPSYRWGLDVAIASQFSGTPNIIRTEHNPIMSPPGRVNNLMMRIADRKISKFVYVSEGNKNRYENNFPTRQGRGYVINNGIDPDKFSPLKDTETFQSIRTEFGFAENNSIAVFVGSYGDRRPLRPIFEAFLELLNNPEIKELVQNWRILIIGNGAKEEEAIPRELGIENYIHFAGPRKDINRILPHTNLYVSASHFEGMSISFLEAWAAGVPVLAAQVDGITEIIGADNFNRYMAPHNEVKRYAQIWKEFIIKSPELLEIHKNATETVRARFTTRHMINNYLDLYEIPPK